MSDSDISPWIVIFVIGLLILGFYFIHKIQCSLPKECVICEDSCRNIPCGEEYFCGDNKTLYIYNREGTKGFSVDMDSFFCENLIDASENTINNKSRGTCWTPDNWRKEYPNPFCICDTCDK